MAMTPWSIVAWTTETKSSSLACMCWHQDKKCLYSRRRS